MQAEYPPNAPWQHAPQPYPVMPVQPLAPQSGVVWLPPIANDRLNLDLRLRGGLGILLALVVGGLYIPVTVGNALSNFAGVVEVLFILLGLGFCLLFGIRMLLEPRRWSVVNQRRQWAAASGSASGVPLAEPQPFPNIEALPVPFTIKLKRQWLVLTFGFCLYAVLLFALQLTSYIQEGWSLQQSLAHISDSWLLLFPFFLLPIAFCFVGGVMAAVD